MIKASVTHWGNQYRPKHRNEGMGETMEDNNELLGLLYYKGKKYV